MRKGKARLVADQPKDTEVPVRYWLEQLFGRENVRFVGNDQQGPPDFLVRYQGETVAVETVLMSDEKGWGTTVECGIRREMEKIIQEEARKGSPSWIVSLEYDPSEQPPDKKKNKKFYDRFRQLLHSPNDGLPREAQLLRPEEMKGYGFELYLYPTKGEREVQQVSVGEGCYPVSELIEHIPRWVAKKAAKVRNAPAFERYGQWWLVLSDDILMAPVSILDGEDRAAVEAKVRGSPGIEQWSKVVLLSRFQSRPPEQDPSDNPPKRFYPFWEDSRHPPLPRSPV